MSDQNTPPVKMTIADRAMEHVFEEVAQLEIQKRPKLREALFLRDWLTFFLGIDTQELADKKRELLRLITGGVPRRVDIVNDAGAVVATIPPVMATDILKLGKFNNDAYVSLFKTYAVLARRAIPEGDRWIAQRRAVIEKAIYELFPNTESSKEWLVLFKHYEKETNELLTQHGQKLNIGVKKSSAADNVEIDGYDEA